MAFLTIFKYIFHLLSSRLFSICHISFRVVAWHDIYFIFAHDLARIFISKNLQITHRIELSSPKRHKYIVVQCELSSIVEDGRFVSAAIICALEPIFIGNCQSLSHWGRSFSRQVPKFLTGQYSGILLSSSMCQETFSLSISLRF